MKKIYLSGKITDNSNAIEQFETAENKFLKAGFEVVNPMKLEHKADATWEDYLRVDIKEMVDCDEIHMLLGWHTSKGARLEFFVASSLGIKITFEPLF